MKKNILLNAEVSYVISKMGHTDSLVIGDAGLPIPEGVQRIDLAISKGIPSFMQVLEAVLSEQKVEKLLLADEIKTASPKLHQDIVEICTRVDADLHVEYVTHERLKAETAYCKCGIRTGEFTPYANVILYSGVVF